MESPRPQAAATPSIERTATKPRPPAPPRANGAATDGKPTDPLAPGQLSDYLDSIGLRRTNPNGGSEGNNT